MELIKKGDSLAMLNKQNFENTKPFGLILRDTGEKEEDGSILSSIFYRLGLVELGVRNESLKESDGGYNSIIISNQSQVLQTDNGKEESTQEAKIQVNPEQYK